jgi:hypothetical protein
MSQIYTRKKSLKIQQKPSFFVEKWWSFAPIKQHQCEPFFLWLHVAKKLYKDQMC